MVRVWKPRFDILRPRLAATRQPLFLFCFLCFFGSKSQEDKKDKKDKDKDKDKKDKKDKEDTSAEFFCGEITNNKPQYLPNGLNIYPLVN